ncbi:7-cyano-7-deazaguanine synthase [Roseiconus lacunae]|uniref:7-cyano-7-deazaguanine synthase n=1 Tax=Roseiconus lacunae TaxID=2605694 RepID=UPI0036F2A637
MDHEALVLLSGGIDSTACLHFFIEAGRFPEALFVDYRQRAAIEERSASKAVAAHFGVPLRTLKLEGVSEKRDGFIPGRNMFLLSAALLETRHSITTIALGIHSGTAYADCSKTFLRSAQDALSLSSDKRIHIAAPFIEWNKQSILEYCSQFQLPIGITYSCEQGGEPCGKCFSCKDRVGADEK